MSAGLPASQIAARERPPDRAPEVPHVIAVRRFEARDSAAIDRLNDRLASGGVADRVWPESETTPAQARGDPCSQELYVAAEAGEIRGGVWLHEHEFILDGASIQAGWLKYPVAESLINREYGGVPGAMIVTAVRRQRLLMALGMGGRHMPFAQILSALGWTLVDIPFYVAPVRPARALRRIPLNHRFIADVLAFSGIATAAASPLNVLRKARSYVLLREVTAAEVPSFGHWADVLWQDASRDYGFIARRDARMLNAFYDRPGFWKLTRLRIQRQGKDIGWACVTFPRIWGANTQERHSLRMGMIADALSRPTDAPAVLAAATQFLVDAGMDVIVTNQFHRVWRAPLRGLGYARRPTNFIFACSRHMADRLGPRLAAADVFLNRGDCDGPPP